MNDTPILDFFYEIECPFCRSVRINIVDKLEAKGVIIVNRIDVDANLGRVEMEWFHKFAEGEEGEPTPLLRLHDKFVGENNWEFAFLMWKKKPTTITEEVLTSEEYLEKQIYDKIRLMEDTLVLPVPSSYEMQQDLFLVSRRMGLDARIY